MSPATDDALWAKDSQEFIHDQYMALKDYLLHTEQRREQSMSLYFTLLAAIVAAMGAALTASGLAAGHLPVLELALVSIGTSMGAYTYGLMLFYRHVAFEFRFEMDKITLRWARYREDHQAYYHLPDIVKGCLIPRSDPETTSSRRLSFARRVIFAPIKRIWTALKSSGYKLRRLLSNEKDALFIMSANSLGTGLAVSLFANPLASATLHIPALPNWLQHPAHPYIWGTVVWVLQVSFYIYQHQRLLGRAQVTLQAVAVELQRGQSTNESLAADR